MLIDLVVLGRDKWWGKPLRLRWPRFHFRYSLLCPHPPPTLTACSQSQHSTPTYKNWAKLIQLNFRLYTVPYALRCFAHRPPLLRVKQIRHFFQLWHIHSSLWKLCTSCTSRCEIFLLLPLSLNWSSVNNVWPSFKFDRRQEARCFAFKWAVIKLQDAQRKPNFLCLFLLISFVAHAFGASFNKAISGYVVLVT